jgi:hypothetical protein
LNQEESAPFVAGKGGIIACKAVHCQAEFSQDLVEWPAPADNILCSFARSPIP